MTARTIPQPVEHTAPHQPVAPASPPRISVQDYLEMERVSKTRHEYVDGEIIDMAGGSPVYDCLSLNALLRLATAFGDGPCKPFTANFRVRVNPTQYRYPDVSALCGDAQFTDENPPALLNPTLIIEVLSPSTASNDRDDKFNEYRQVASVVDYLLIEQDKVEAAHFARQSAVQWNITIYSHLADTLKLESVGVSLTLSDLYRKTPLASPPAESASTSGE